MIPDDKNKTQGQDDRRDPRPLRIPRLEYTNSSRKIHDGPCALIAAVVTGNGAAGNAGFYDGVDARGDLKLNLQALTSLSASASFGKGAYFAKGLHVVVAASTTAVAVFYVPLPDGLEGLRDLAI